MVGRSVAVKQRHAHIHGLAPVEAGLRSVLISHASESLQRARRDAAACDPFM